MEQQHEEAKSGVCEAHGPLLEAISSLKESMAGVRNDLKWYLRLGAGIFSLCGIITTATSPAIVQLYNRISATEKEVLQLRNELKNLKEQEIPALREMDQKILIQRNMDHKSTSPLLERR